MISCFQSTGGQATVGPTMAKASTPDFADRLRAWREAKGFGRAIAAVELGVKKSVLISWEQRRRSPLLETAAPVLRRLEKDGF